MTEGDSRARYPVQEYLDVRIRAGRGSRVDRVEALIRWEGARWVGADTWEPASSLTPDLRVAVMQEADERFPARRAVTLVARRAAVVDALRGYRLRRASGDMAGLTRDASCSDSEDAGDDGSPIRSVRVLDENCGRRRRRRQIGPLQSTSEDETMEDA